MLKGKDQLPVSIRQTCRRLRKEWVSSMKYTGEYRDLEMDSMLIYKDPPSYQDTLELEVMLVSSVDYTMHSYLLESNNFSLVIIIWNCTSKFYLISPNHIWTLVFLLLFTAIKAKYRIKLRKENTFGDWYWLQGLNRKLH